MQKGGADPPTSVQSGLALAGRCMSVAPGHLLLPLRTSSRCGGVGSRQTACGSTPAATSAHATGRSVNQATSPSPSIISSIDDVPSSTWSRLGHGSISSAPSAGLSTACADTACADSAPSIAEDNISSSVTKVMGARSSLRRGLIFSPHASRRLHSGPERCSSSNSTSNRKIIGHFSIEIHHFSGVMFHSFCIFNRNIGKFGIYIAICILARSTDPVGCAARRQLDAAAQRSCC